jgi:hypothetical protein
MSDYEGEHTIFGLLGQANLTQNDVLQFHPLKITSLKQGIDQAWWLMLVGDKDWEHSDLRIAKQKGLVTCLSGRPSA